MTPPTANRLANESSPYLLQHAHNPVDWFPWGEEALSRAKRDDKPIFLSVGYSACHWCHVMERESFEDPDTAELMNANFVSIKVDREERPDVDSIYMDAVQTMTGQGGWPMSAFLTPDGRPFYAGTYYPDEPRHGMPSFRQVLRGIADAWRERRDEIEAQAGKVTQALELMGQVGVSEQPISEATLVDAFENLRRGFDPRWGGFGGAPKFPQPMVLEFVMRQALRGRPDALEMLVLTLDRMADGGMYDQLGGGFARYSTDQAWFVPHFEKMLYDNAQLAQLYIRAWLMTRDDGHRRVATETLEYLLREMRGPGGGFWSSQDADSEGVEGKFFTWTWEELVSIVGEAAAEAFGALPAGNWAEDAASGAISGMGTNILRRPHPDVGPDIEEARSKLFAAREARVRPGTDDKVLTAWNAMAIRAFAEAGRAFAEPRYVEAAEACAHYVLGTMRGPGGRLLRSVRDGSGSVPGFADDHALLASALLTLYETTFDLDWFRQAKALCDDLLRLFLDKNNGGFFQAGSDAEPLVIRPKDLTDSAVPSGNSAAAEALLRLGLITGDGRYRDAGSACLALVNGAAAKAPAGFGTALCAIDLYVGPSREVAVIGERDDERTEALVREVVSKRYVPNVVLAAAGPGDKAAAREVPLLEGRALVEGKPAAYVCEGFTCELPVTEPADLARLLRPGGS
jgi:uncharacterized protein